MRFVAVIGVAQRQPVRAERQGGQAEIGIDLEVGAPGPPDRRIEVPFLAGQVAQPPDRGNGSLSAPAGSPMPTSTRRVRRNGMPARPASPQTMPSASAGGSAPSTA